MAAQGWVNWIFLSGSARFDWGFSRGGTRNCQRIQGNSEFREIQNLGAKPTQTLQEGWAEWAERIPVWLKKLNFKYFYD